MATLALKAIVPNIYEQWARAVDGVPCLYRKLGSLGFSMIPRKKRHYLRDAIQLQAVEHQIDTHMATYYFTSMYTTLPVQDIKKRLEKLLDSIYQHRRQTLRGRILMLGQYGTFKWIAAGRRSEMDREVMMSLDEFKDMLNKLVLHFSQFSGELWHQTVEAYQWVQTLLDTFPICTVSHMK